MWKNARYNFLFSLVFKYFMSYFKSKIRGRKILSYKLEQSRKKNEKNASSCRVLALAYVHLVAALILWA